LACRLTRIMGPGSLNSSCAEWLPPRPSMAHRWAVVSPLDGRGHLLNSMTVRVCWSPFRKPNRGSLSDLIHNERELMACFEGGKGGHRIELPACSPRAAAPAPCHQSVRRVKLCAATSGRVVGEQSIEPSRYVCPGPVEVPPPKEAASSATRVGACSNFRQGRPSFDGASGQCVQRKLRPRLTWVPRRRSGSERSARFDLKAVGGDSPRVWALNETHSKSGCGRPRRHALAIGSGFAHLRALAR